MHLNIHIISNTASSHMQTIALLNNKNTTYNPKFYLQAYMFYEKFQNAKILIRKICILQNTYQDIYIQTSVYNN